MFPMTITINDQQQLDAVLKAFGQPTNLPPAEQPIVQAVVKAVKQAEKVTEQVVESKKPEASPSTGTTSEPEASSAPSATGGYTIEDARRLTTEAVKAGKRDDIVALLKEFDVAQAAKLKPEQITPFCLKAEGLFK